MTEIVDKKLVCFSLRTLLLALFVALVAALASASANADSSDQPSFVIGDKKTAYSLITEDSCSYGKGNIKNESEYKVKNQVQHDVRIYHDSVTYRHELPRKKF